MINKIIICENQALIAMDIKKVLESDGYAVSAAVGDFESLLDAVDFHRPDLVTMDVKMNGDISGYQMAKTLMNIFPLHILFITGAASFEHKKEFINNPRTNFLTKPFQKSELLDIIKSFDSAPALNP